MDSYRELAQQTYGLVTEEEIELERTTEYRNQYSARQLNTVILRANREYMKREKGEVLVDFRTMQIDELPKGL